MGTCALATAMAWKHDSTTQSLHAKVLTTVAAPGAVSVRASADTDGRQGSLPGLVDCHRSFPDILVMATAMVWVASTFTSGMYVYTLVLLV